MLASPAMTYASTISLPKKEKMSCCANKAEKHNSENQAKDCKDTHKEDNGCKDNCPTNDCCIYVNIMKNFTEDLNQKFQFFSFPEQQPKNEFYSTPYIKDISYSFWHPPKYIS